MRLHRVVRYFLLACSSIFLTWVAWKALSGAFRQIPRARTAGQKVETVAQVECGALSLLVVFTSFWRRRWAEPVWTAWSISLAVMAGLSALVWGPPMPLTAVLFAAIALFVARLIHWMV